FGDGLALDGLGHHGGRRLADGAALAAEADVDDGIALDEQIQGDLVSAQRVVQVDGRGGIREFAPVLGPPIMLHDHLLVQSLKRHPGKTPSPCTAPPPPGPRRCDRYKYRSWPARW